ncbi:iron-containing alcohol dehydrogenase [Alteromonas flava]|uniref:iron-containing alcohol dehydrogenase n=1 Tax=Alteromonas flava TaxID=2048003 RepID=UPI000C28C9C7|nr:iron-containing alcohol dehydrogenase [Alteromonas flava]
MITNIQIPPQLKVGAGAINEIGPLLTQLGVSNPAIIADPIMITLGQVDKLIDQLGALGISPYVHGDVMPEPDDKSIVAAVAMVAQSQCDGLIALGGGSAIDSAKAIALLASHGGQMRDYKVPNVVTQTSMPVIAIPTTAGTGSECTKVTVISDSQSQEKMLCMGPGLMPAAAILDYELTLSVPFRVAADTGIDALTHAIEAFVSRKANAMSDQLAISAMRLIAPNLISACLSPENHAAKEAMMLGASLAGMAFSNASVALVHGMSRPLGVHFHVPHGMSNAMLLRSVTEFSLTGSSQKYAECAFHLGITNSIQDVAANHQVLLNYIEEVVTTLKVPTMSEFGIAQLEYDALLDVMAEQALASGSPANNPRNPTSAEIIEIYRQVYA